VRKFGEAKQKYGLGCCHYVGKMRFIVHTYFIAIMLNFKRMVKILTVVGFKSRVSPA